MEAGTPAKVAKVANHAGEVESKPPATGRAKSKASTVQYRLNQNCLSRDLIFFFVLKVLRPKRMLENRQCVIFSRHWSMAPPPNPLPLSMPGWTTMGGALVTLSTTNG